MSQGGEQCHSGTGLVELLVVRRSDKVKTVIRTILIGLAILVLLAVVAALSWTSGYYQNTPSRSLTGIPNTNGTSGY